MKPIKLTGRTYDCTVDFPWERAVFVSIRFETKTGQLVEQYELQADLGAYSQYRTFIPYALDFLKRLIGRYD